jgi:hypoxanthine phosphoribosyltransferase
MKKTHYTWQDIETFTTSIAKQIVRDDWRPDYIVGLTRGGLIPAAMLSHFFGVPCETLKVSLRDGGNTESNCWMSEDAFGYIPDGPLREGIDKRSDATFKKRILIVDDINDTGATLNWIKQDWQSSCLPDDSTWETVWGDNVRVATIVDKWDSKSVLPVKYSGVQTNLDLNLGWVVFPWEGWCGE